MNAFKRKIECSCQCVLQLSESEGLMPDFSIGMKESGSKDYGVTRINNTVQAQTMFEHSVGTVGTRAEATGRNLSGQFRGYLAVQLI